MDLYYIISFSSILPVPSAPRQLPERGGRVANLIGSIQIIIRALPSLQGKRIYFLPRILAGYAF